MNATRNFCEILDEIEDIGNDEKAFLVSAYKNFKDRLKHLKTAVEKVNEQPDFEKNRTFLQNCFEAVEKTDKNFIQTCSRSVTKGIIVEDEVTRLLMANRLFTQSSRMLVLSMQSITNNFIPQENI
jgi:phosphate:Na+ symporter